MEYASSSPSLHWQAGCLKRAGYNTCPSSNISLSSAYRVHSFKLLFLTPPQRTKARNGKHWPSVFPERRRKRSKISTPSTKFLFLGPIGKTRWPLWPLIGTHIFDCSLKPFNGIQRNLTGSKIPTSSTKFVFFGPIGKTRWPRGPLIDWDIFDFSSETAERNFMKLDRKQDLNVLCQVCVFRTDREKQDGRPGLWLTETFSTFKKPLTEFNETGQKARSQRPLPSLCFSGPSGIQDCRSGFWLAEAFSTSPLKPCNGIQRNLTGSKIPTSSTKFVFFGPIGKTRWLPGLW